MSRVERHFLGKSQGFLRAAAERLVTEVSGESGDSGPIDLRDRLVVLPGSRAARLLLRQLTQISHDRGVGLLPPEIETPGQLEPQLIDRELPRITPEEERLSWLMTLQAASLPQKELLGIEETTSGNASGLLKVGQLLSNTVRQLKQEGSNPGAAAHCMAPRDTEAAKRLLVVEELENFRLELLRNWGVHPGGFSQASPREVHRKVILIGILELPSTTRAWLEEHCRCQIWIDAESEDHHLYDDWGRPISEMWSQLELADSIPMIVADQPADLTLAVVQHISDQTSIEKMEDVSLGLLDEDLTPWLTEGLRRHGMGIHPAAGKPHSLTSTGRLVEGIRRVVAGGSFSAFSALARHPLVLKLLPMRTDHKGAEIEVLKDLDRWSTERQPDQAEDPNAPPALLHLQEQLSPLMSDDDLLHQRIDQYLQVLGNLVGTDADGFPLIPEGEGDLLIETLEKLRECGPQTELHLAADNFVSLVCALTMDSLIPEENDPSSIQGLGWLELAMDEAPHLILTGISEGKLSGSLTSDPLIPESLRRELGIPGYEERVARDTHLLRSLVDGRRHTIVALSARDSQGNPQLPSRLLLRGEAGVQRLRDFLQPEKRVLLKEQITQPAEEFADLGPPRSIDAPTPEKISVTGFARWIADPVLFQLERTLKCSECHDRDLQLSPMAFGNMVHWVLETYGKTEALRDLKDRDAILEAVDSLLDQYCRKKLAQHPRAAVLVQVEQARARLEIWATQQTTLRFQGWKIMATEIALDPEHCRLTVPEGSIGVSGRIDRIDRNEKTGEWRILDYKTSEQGPSPEKDHGRRPGRETEWKKLQLPLYRHFASTLVLEGVQLPADPEVGFFNLPGTTSARSVQIAAWTDDDFDDAIARAHEIASEILSPEERTLEVLTPPWDRALAGVVIDAEKSLSAMLEVSAEDEVEA